MKVVLLHSALGDSRLWRGRSRRCSGDHEVVTPDLPGWGTSPLPTEPFSFVDAVAEHLPAALVGNSFGGALALRTALAKQELVSRLVVIAAGLPTWDWSEEMRAYWAAEEAAFDAGDLDLATQVNLDFWVKPEHQEEVRPQQRRAFELQIGARRAGAPVAGDGAARDARDPDARRRRRGRQAATSARSRITWRSTSRTRSSSSSRAPAISSASTDRTSSTRCCSGSCPNERCPGDSPGTRPLLR